MVRQVNIKKRLLRIFFVIEVLVFGATYFFGPQGLRALRHMHAMNDALRVEIMQLELEVGLLHQEMDEWEGDSFKREKIAREQLQMARSGETIYLLDDKK